MQHYARLLHADELAKRLASSHLASDHRHSSLLADSHNHATADHARNPQPVDILTAIAHRPDLSGKTTNNYVSVLRDAFALAVTDKVLAVNRVAGLPRAKHQKPPPDPFSREEAELISTETARAYDGNIHNMVETWFWTGLRTSEILGLDRTCPLHGPTTIIGTNAHVFPVYLCYCDDVPYVTPPDACTRAPTQRGSEPRQQPRQPKSKQE